MNRERVKYLTRIHKNSCSNFTFHFCDLLLFTKAIRKNKDRLFPRTEAALSTKLQGRITTTLGPISRACLAQTFQLDCIMTPIESVLVNFVLVVVWYNKLKTRRINILTFRNSNRKVVTWCYVYIKMKFIWEKCNP